MARLGDMFSRAFWAPVKAVLPKNPWLRIAIIAIPILLVMALLEPVFGLLEKGVDLMVRLIAPLMETSGGRLLLLNLVLLFLVVVTFLILRSRLRRLFSGLVLRRHLDGIGQLLDDESKTARDSFRRVAKSRALPPSVFPQIREDAKLKLARLSLDSGQADQAIHWLTKIKEVGMPKELKRSLAQLRARSFLAQGEILDESMEAELRSSLERFPGDPVLAALLRDQMLQRGRLEDAAKAQEMVYKNSSSSAREVERQRLVEDYVRCGDEALSRGELELARSHAKKAQKLAPKAPEAGCLLGKVLVAKGDALAGIREWGSTRSATGFELLSKLLDEHPGIVSPRELLEACPIEGTVLLVAREYARQGDTRRAERAARAATRNLGLTPSTAAVLAEVLELCGRAEDAKTICQEAVKRLVAPEGTSS
ncbi:MAG: tetratricopeptide repeat protein [Planctomycetota bacterium]|jgi:tetratricopeptide (TPR) repeat protein